MESKPTKKDDPRLQPARAFLHAALEQKFTKVPSRARQKLENADMASLKRWSRRVAACDEIMDVFD